MIITLEEAASKERQTSYLYFINDKETNNPLIAILIDIKNKYKSIDDNHIEVTLDDIDISSTIHTVELLKWFDKNKESTNRDLLYQYLNRFENIYSWLKLTYEPKWKKALGEEFPKAVIDFIKNDIYLFSCSFDNITSYESMLDDTKKYIKQ